MKPFIVNQNKKKKIHIFKNFIKRFYKPALLIVIIQFSILLPILYKNKSKVVVYLANNLGRDLPYEYKSLNLIKGIFIDYFIYISELIQATYKSDNLEKVDLQLPYKSLATLECFRKNKGQEELCKKNRAVWVKGNLVVNDDSYPVKIRPKGDREINRINFKKMSLKVDIRGDKRYRGMEEFGIQSPIIRGYTNELFTSKIVKKEGLVAPRQFYVKFFLNGTYLGVRHIEEGFTKELIESSKRRYGPVFSLNENLSTNIFNTNFELANKKDWVNKEIVLEAVSILESLKTSKNIDTFQKYFDQEKWAKYLAIMDIFKTYHGATPKSVKFFLNPSTGLFEPIFFNGHMDQRIKNLRFSDFMNTKLMSKENCGWLCLEEDNRSDWYQLLFGSSKSINKKFYMEYFNTLEKYSSAKSVKLYLKNEWNNLKQERGSLYREFWKKDKTWHEGITLHVNKWSNFENHLNNIKDEVSKAKSVIPLFSIDKKNKKIQINNQFSRLPQILTFKCNAYKSEPFILVKDVKKDFSFGEIPDCKFDNITYSLDKGFSQKYIYDSYSTSKLIDEKIESNKKLKIKEFSQFQNNDFENLFVFQKGINTINSSKEINEKNIIFESGSKICLNNKSTLKISNSNVTFANYLNEGVLIESCDEKGGNILIEDSNVLIDNLSLKNLGSPSESLRILYGGFNLINSDVVFKNIKIESSKSEDAINFINSSVVGKKLIVKNTFSDAIDSDFSKLVIDKIDCFNIGNDCYDISETYSSINTLIANKVNDKALSIGESSNIKIGDIKVTDSEIGIVSKDSSFLEVEKYSYDSVKIPVTAYIKKSELGSPTINLKKVYPNLKDFDFISKDSYVTIDNKKINSDKTSKEISDSLYGNIYGVKTIR